MYRFTFYGTPNNNMLKISAAPLCFTGNDILVRIFPRVPNSTIMTIPFRYLMVITSLQTTEFVYRIKTLHIIYIQFSDNFIMNTKNV